MHRLAIIGSLSAMFLVASSGAFLKGKVHKWVARAIGLYFCIDMLIHYTLYAPAEFNPCNSMQLFLILTIWTKWRWGHEATLFIGVVAALVGTIFPDVGSEGVYYEAAYFARHIFIVATPIFLLFAPDRQTSLCSIPKLFFQYIPLVLTVGIYDAFFGKNHMWLREPDIPETLQAIALPWPWYILQATVVLFIGGYLVRFFVQRLQKKSRPTTAVRQKNSVKKVLIFYHKFGGGHFATASALKAEIIKKTDCKVVLSELFSRDVGRTQFEKFARGLYKAQIFIYKKLLQYDLTALVKLMQLSWIVRLAKLIARMVKPFFLRVLVFEQPDLVVSTVPVYNKALTLALKSLSYEIPLVITLSDYRDPLKLWFDRKIRYEKLTYLCPSKAALKEGLERGIPQEMLVELSGLIVRGQFYKKLPKKVEEPKTRVGIVFFGGAGSNKMVQIVEELHEKVELIVLCGHNKKLIKKLNSLETKHKLSCYGFVQDVENYMQKADFFIGKPGPGAVAEALLSGLLIITFANFHTMLQERDVADYIEQRSLGIVVKSYKEVGEAVEMLLSDYAFYKKNVLEEKNRGVFEAADFIVEKMSKKS